MRIIEIRECAIPLKSSLRNSSFDFSEMTTSVVAVSTDVLREGKPVTGFAFNSTGRYACGAAMRARFIPRILAADPQSLLDDTGENFDPSKKFLAVMMQREKSGGHSERSIAIGTIEVAIWDAVAKIAGKPLLPSPGPALRRGQGQRPGLSVTLAEVGAISPARPSSGSCRTKLRRHLDAGYTMVKMKVGGLKLSRRMCAESRRYAPFCLPMGSLQSIANSQFEREEALAYAQGACAPQLRWFEEPCDPLDFALLAEIAASYVPQKLLAAGRKSILTPRRQNLLLRRFAARSQRRHSSGPAARLRNRAICPHARPDRGAGMARSALFPHGGNQMSLAIAGGLGFGGAESYPGSALLAGLPTTQKWRTDVCRFQSAPA